ncbi:hypothetical protein V6N12_062701 [Hibiscus sabdariffa]|uniref:Uncharacterized protein n=1 Tax=Hibiscus sabdariffa TaxID=183260 RepID=A0ABR2F9L4_9ROSI
MVDVHMSNNRAALRLFLDSFGGTEPSSVPANSVSPGNSQESLPGSVAAEKHDTDFISLTCHHQSNSLVILSLFM